ncbi:unnamed protein product [Aphanomyces euteiches]|nr:hypothetical protein AeRB84_015837 [Aphanomyces euteiches]
MQVEERYDPASQERDCLGDMTCVCHTCYMSFVHNRLLEFQEHPNVFASPILERFKFFLAYSEAHTIQRVERPKRTGWKLTNYPKAVFPSLEGLVYSWYGAFPLIKDCNDVVVKLPPLTQPPLPPQQVSDCLFTNCDGSAIYIGGGCTKQRRFQADFATSFTVKYFYDIANPMSYRKKVSCISKGFKLTGPLADIELNKHPGIKQQIEASKRPMYTAWTYSDFASPALSQLDEDGGGIQQSMLVDIFQTAHLNPTSVFLDLGSGAGHAMICASGFKPRLVLGLEASLSCVATSVRDVLESKMCAPIYPIHASIDEVSYYDPASHVFCDVKGMNSPVISAIRCAIMRSASVMYVISSHPNLLDSSKFRTIAHKTTASVGSSATYTLYLYKRRTQPRGGKCHPIFYLPVYLTHFSACWPLVLRSYLLSLEVESYERHYCRGSLVEARNVEMKNSSLPPHYLVVSSHASIGLLSTSQQCQGNANQVSATTRLKNRDRPVEFITSSPQLTQDCTVNASATYSCTATVCRNGVSASSYVHSILRMSDAMIVSINEYNDRAVYNIASMSNDDIIARIKDATCTPWAPTKEIHGTYDETDMDAVWNVARELHLDKHDVFINIGSGKGRLVMLLAVKMDLHCHIGIEIDHDRQQVVVKAKQTLVGEDAQARMNTFIKNKDLFNREHVPSDSGSVLANNGRFKQETNELIKNLLVSNLGTMYLVVTANFSYKPSDSHPMLDDFMSLPPVEMISMDSPLSATVSPSPRASDEPWNARTNANVLWATLQ